MELNICGKKIKNEKKDSQVPHVIYFFVVSFFCLA